MRRLTRDLPEVLHARVPAGARVLRVLALPDGDHAVLTSASLIVGGDAVTLDRPWSDVDAASWDSEEGAVTISWVDGSAPTSLAVGEQAKVAEFVYALKERIDHSLVLLETVQLSGGGYLRGAIRRNADGSLFSQVTISGVSRPPSDVDARVAALESRIRAAVGLD
ncbi:hypothetical protein [Ruania halotolerans]|uniref:hypothetical protein n=1 Tax=Ruania halotolerans TaxID=2897773 RepID=UPI001E30F191|nr:hypothetical protein [Ruania halotolerans]UFU04908.1 hypothetical protein LQF10_10475 [Ruania halotolerans]